MPIFDRSFPQDAQGSDGTAQSKLLQLQQENQSLRLALQEKGSAITQLQADLETLRAGQETTFQERLNARLERFINDASGPAVQLLAQAYLLEKEHKPVQISDLLAVSRRLLGALERIGLEYEGQVGQRVPFDPERHALLDASDSLYPGEQAEIRFVGVRYRGKIIRKAILDCRDR